MKGLNLKVKGTLIGAMTVGAMTALLVVGGPGNAQAAPRYESTTDRVNKALSAVDAIQVLGPSVASGKVDINSDKPSASIAANGKSLRVTYAGAKSNRSERDGSSRSFGDVATDTDSVVRPSAGGVQLLAVMRTAAAPTVQRYKLDLPEGVHLRAAGAGFALVNEGGGIAGTIAEPWAKDATGKSLPTSYTIEGNDLVQHTDTTGAQYPVVADPNLSYGWNVYLSMWGYQARAYAVEIGAIGGTLVIASCALLWKIPNPYLRSFAQLACGAVSLNLQTLFRSLYRVATENNPLDYLCYQWNLSQLNARQGVNVNSDECRNS